MLRQAAEEVVANAEAYVQGTRFEWDRTFHNAHLVRSRMLGNRVTTLLVRWIQTGEERFRAAAVDHVAELGRWKHWSWIMWRRKDPRPEAIFDLSYGENSMTLGVAYDWLHGSLSPAEDRMFRQIARDRSLRPFLHVTDEKNLGKMELADPWWFGWPNSNWNAVCAGGAGMLALAMYDDLPEAPRVLARVERSLGAFMGFLKQTGGAWPEGIGYWNFGMRFAFTYLLSWERATGRAHPLLRGREVRETLRFPMDFCPNGVACSFGDVNHWAPLPYHYAAAERLNCPDVLRALDTYRREEAPVRRCWPTAVELLLLHPRRKSKPVRPEKNVVKLYKGQDWGILADRWPQPRMYLAVRGGNMEAPHSHRDLLSFHCVLGDEAMIRNVGVDEYLDIPYGQRRYEQPELNEKSKNTILINGFGIGGEGASVRTSRVRLSRASGIRMDATRAISSARGQKPIRFCGRLLLMLPGRGFLILDRVELVSFGRVESRMHTYADVRLLRAGAKLTGERARMRVTYASDSPAQLHSAQMAPTVPGVGAKVLRWCTPDRSHKSVTMATLLTCGLAPARLRVESEAGKITVRIEAGGRPLSLAVTTRLRPIRKGPRR